uniref:histidine kinase n=1 Tax=Paenibacillus athensensis TaxID=1967502 RepID=A0A4Y8PX02_9BACL
MGTAALLPAVMFSVVYAVCFASIAGPVQIGFLFAGTMIMVTFIRHATDRRVRGELLAHTQQLAAQAPAEQMLNKLMLEVQEAERKRIAADLHDTTMQDLFFLKRKLACLLGTYMMSDEDEKQLQSLLHFVEMINVGLRQNCFELDPYLLQETSLANMINMYLDKERVNEQFQIDFEADEALFANDHDVQLKKHLFRVVQELLNNAKKHSQASRVSFRLRESAGQLVLSYKDNGVGFEENKAKRGMGLYGKGIEQLKGRISHLHGQARLETGKEQGVQWTITLPAQTV